MSKYAPALPDGRKPYVVEIQDWGRRRSILVYADDSAGARRKARRNLPKFAHITSIRRKPSETELAKLAAAG